MNQNDRTDTQRMRSAVLAALWCLLSSPALAQSAYVVASVAAEISRAGQRVTDGFGFPTPNGEALGGSIRVGVIPRDTLAIEVEVAAGGYIGQTVTVEPSTDLVHLLPELESGVFHLSRRDRAVTVTTAAAIRQRISDVADLAYIAGIAFYRITLKSGLEFVPRFPPTLLEATPDSATVAYGAGPAFGLEAHIGPGDHLKLVPGIRIHAVGMRWLLRPGVGVGWSF